MPTTKEYQERVCRAMNFISRNIERELSLEEIAESAAFSRFHFHRIFKAVVGETVADFTRRLRLELAANRLLSAQFSDITTVALNCGFSSSQNFAKAFRQHFGVTPSQYRKSKIGNMPGKNENAPSLRAVYDVDRLLRDAPRGESRAAMRVDVTAMPALTVAYVRKIGPYIPEVCGAGFAELMRWAAPRNVVGAGTVLAIYWDNPEVTPPDRCRFDACNLVPAGTAPEGQVFIQTIPAGLYALCHFERPPSEIQQAWEDAYLWLCGSGYESSDAPCYERYYNDAAQHPQGNWIFDICIPLKSET